MTVKNKHYKRNLFEEKDQTYYKDCIFEHCVFEVVDKDNYIDTYIEDCKLIMPIFEEFKTKEDYELWSEPITLEQALLNCKHTHPYIRKKSNQMLKGEWNENEKREFDTRSLQGKI